MFCNVKGFSDRRQMFDDRNVQTVFGRGYFWKAKQLVLSNGFVCQSLINLQFPLHCRVKAFHWSRIHEKFVSGQANKRTPFALSVVWVLVSLTNWLILVHLFIPCWILSRFSRYTAVNIPEFISIHHKKPSTSHFRSPDRWINDWGRNQIVCLKRCHPDLCDRC